MIGDNIKKIRLQKGICRTELARKSSVNYRSIENIEKGKTKNPGIIVIQKISLALGVSVDVLLNERLEHADLTTQSEIIDILKEKEIVSLVKSLRTADVEKLQKLLDFLIQLSRKKEK